jgi:hypothetical protein
MIGHRLCLIWRLSRMMRQNTFPPNRPYPLIDIDKWRCEHKIVRVFTHSCIWLSCRGRDKRDNIPWLVPSFVPLHRISSYFQAYRQNWSSLLGPPSPKIAINNETRHYAWWVGKRIDDGYSGYSTFWHVSLRTTVDAMVNMDNAAIVVTTLLVIIMVSASK